MTISDTMKKAIESGDIATIHSSFYTIILSDPGFQTNRFEEALEYVKKANIDGWMDEHDGEELLPETEWNDEYFDMLAWKLQDNFSEQRIEQLKKVAYKLSESKDNDYDTDKADSMERTTDEDDSANSTIDDELNWILIIGVVLVILWILRWIFKGGRR